MFSFCKTLCTGNLFKVTTKIWKKSLRHLDNIYKSLLPKMSNNHFKSKHFFKLVFDLFSDIFFCKIRFSSLSFHFYRVLSEPKNEKAILHNSLFFWALDPVFLSDIRILDRDQNPAYRVGIGHDRDWNFHLGRNRDRIEIPRVFTLSVVKIHEKNQ